MWRHRCSLASPPGLRDSGSWVGALHLGTSGWVPVGCWHFGGRGGSSEPGWWPGLWGLRVIAWPDGKAVRITRGGLYPTERTHGVKPVTCFRGHGPLCVLHVWGVEPPRCIVGAADRLQRDHSVPAPQRLLLDATRRVHETRWAGSPHQHLSPLVFPSPSCQCSQCDCVSDLWPKMPLCTDAPCGPSGVDGTRPGGRESGLSYEAPSASPSPQPCPALRVSPPVLCLDCQTLCCAVALDSVPQVTSILAWGPRGAVSP